MNVFNNIGDKKLNSHVSALTWRTTDYHFQPAKSSYLVKSNFSLNTQLTQSCCMSTVPLLHVLAVHARLLAHWPTWEMFQVLAGVQEDPLPVQNAVDVMANQVPILLCDPCALLTQFILLLPLHLDQSE